MGKNIDTLFSVSCPRASTFTIKRLKIFVKELYSSIYPSFHSYIEKLVFHLNVLGVLSIFIAVVCPFQFIYLHNSLDPIFVYRATSIS